jgi:hypothetical protein
MRLVVFSLIIILGFGTCAQSETQSGCWPPLNGTSQIIESPVRVGEHTFGSGSYSFFVGRYSVPSLHCEETIDTGPREWYLMVESGRVEVKGEPQGTKHGPLPLPSPPLPPLGDLPPLQLSTLPPLPQLTAMPSLGTVPPLTDLPPLR